MSNDLSCLVDVIDSPKNISGSLGPLLPGVAHPVDMNVISFHSSCGSDQMTLQSGNQ